MLATYMQRMRNSNQAPVVQTLDSAIRRLNNWAGD